MPENEVRFCPLLTVVRAGQPTYMVCQTNCAFYLESECAFITIAKLLKENVNPKVIDIVKGQKDES